MSIQKIYLDHAATTPARQEVVEAMLPYFTEDYGNPSAVYKFSSITKYDLTMARTVISDSLGTNGDNIYFTSGGTEADNWALIGIAEAYQNKGKHIITTKIEHHAILHTAEYLKERGFEITYLDVDSDGMVRLDDLKQAIRPDTILISVMFANNEIGTIQPIKEIGALAKEQGIIFHTDAVQAYGHIPIDVKELNIDILSASGHKLYGPKGIGFLYIRKGIKIRSFIHGGAQERNLRAGTENVPGIIGFGKAVELAFADMEGKAENLSSLRDYMISRILDAIPYTRLNGHKTERLPNNINVCFRFVEGEALLIMLSMRGIYASSGSACTSGSQEPSHVLMAIGLSQEAAHSTLRFTLGDSTTKEDIDYVVEQLKEVVANLRSMSPLYVDFQE